MEPSKRYQVCRWYDPYPRLAFAIKLLYWSPAELRERATQVLSQYLLEQVGGEKAYKLGLEDKRFVGVKRGCDSSVMLVQTLELLKRCPDFMKNAFAEKMLHSLVENQRLQP